MVVDIVESWALQRGHFHATQRLLFVDSPEAEASDAASFARSLLHFCFCALQCILRLWGCRFLSGSTKVLAELPRHGKYSSEPRHITCLYFYLFFLHCFLDVLVVNASVREDRHPSTRQVSQLWAIERPDSHLFWHAHRNKTSEVW